MGFPRILSKNNKIYTKLGEFCLSIDGNQFYIVCHTCQQELLTQDTFWKHIQDEHSFMHELKHDGHTEHNRLHNQQNFMDSAAAAVAVEVSPPQAALVSTYRKVNIKAESGGGGGGAGSVNTSASLDGGVGPDEEEDDEQEPKDYTEMRVIEPSAVEVNIKVEQSHMALSGDAATAAAVVAANHQQQQQQQQHQQHEQQQQHAPTSLYMPNTGAPNSMPPAHIINYAGMLGNMPQVCTVLSPSVAASVGGGGGGVGGATAALAMPNNGSVVAPLLEAPKDSSSATSEDGERWYICDFKPCGQKFKYQSRLQLHSTVHSKVRRFVCDVCNASFKQSCNLSTHRKKKHDIRTSRMVK